MRSCLLMVLKEYHGDLLTLKLSPTEYIVHQTNCESTYAMGLAKYIFQQYPSANTYFAGYKRVPGTVSIHDRIVNLYGQNKPGKSRTNAQTHNRLTWFTRGLAELSDILTNNGASIAYFPYGIGCGMAGGNWNTYHDILKEWSNHQSFEVHIVNPAKK
jgi:hypothetical protein